MSRLARDGTAEFETKFSGADGDREIFIFPVQLTTRIKSNLTRLILTWLRYEEECMNGNSVHKHKLL